MKHFKFKQSVRSGAKPIYLLAEDNPFRFCTNIASKISVFKNYIMEELIEFLTIVGGLTFAFYMLGVPSCFIVWLLISAGLSLLCAGNHK